MEKNKIDKIATTDNNDELITIEEGAALLGIDVNSMRNIVRMGKIPSVGKQGRNIMLRKSDVYAYSREMSKRRRLKKAYGNICLDFDESLKPLDSLHNPNGIYNPLQFNSSHQYAVSNKGRVFNLSAGHELARAIGGADGRLLVTIPTYREQKTMKVHRLVAYAWCPNSKNKELVHHIDGDPANNNYTNLVWVTRDQHTEAHRLMRAAADSGDHTLYDAYIEGIKRENAYQHEYRQVTYQNAKGGIVSLTFDKDLYERLDDKETAKDSDNRDIVAATFVYNPFAAQKSSRTMRFRKL